MQVQRELKGLEVSLKARQLFPTFLISADTDNSNSTITKRRDRGNGA